MTVEIPLTQGKVALVDDDDAELVGRYKWYYLPSQTTMGYAFANVNVDCKRTMLYMHRLILPPHDGLEVDHVNSNGLDNRRINLRLCTRSQNLANHRKRNQRKTAERVSLFKGVQWFSRDSRWVAKIERDGLRRHIGYFDSETDAARAYDRAARELFGEFARLNFPEEQAQCK